MSDAAGRSGSAVQVWGLFLDMSSALLCGFKHLVEVETSLLNFLGTGEEIHPSLVEMLDFAVFGKKVHSMKQKSS